MAKCSRCEHEWEPFVLYPKNCPVCKSPYWDKPYKNRPWAEPKNKPIEARKGRPFRFPQLKFMQIGDEFLITWPIHPDGFVNQKELRKIKMCIWREARLYGKKFHLEGRGKGLLICRTK